jgi:hypothetical protein
MESPPVKPPRVTVKDLLTSRCGIPVGIKVNQWLSNKAVFTNDTLFLSPDMWTLYKAALEDQDQAALENLACSIDLIVLPDLMPKDGFFMLPLIDGYKP